MRAGTGFTVIELVVVLAIIGIVGGIGYLLLPRDRFAVNQSTQIVARAVQFARFEAVKQDRSVEIRFDNGATQAVVTTVGTNGTTTTFPLDPTGAQTVTVQSVSAAVVFNARGIATQADGSLLNTPVTVTLGRVGTTTSRTVTINLVGNVENQ